MVRTGPDGNQRAGDGSGGSDDTIVVSPSDPDDGSESGSGGNSGRSGGSDDTVVVSPSDPDDGSGSSSGGNSGRSGGSDDTVVVSPSDPDDGSESGSGSNSGRSDGTSGGGGGFWDTITDAGEDAVDTVQDAADPIIDAGRDAVDAVRDTADQASDPFTGENDGPEPAGRGGRQTAGAIGPSQEFRGYDPSEDGPDSVTPRQTAGATGPPVDQQRIEDTAAYRPPSAREQSDPEPDQSGGPLGNIRGSIDEQIRQATDGNVGLSDDFTSMEDSGGLSGVATAASAPVQSAASDYQEQEGEQWGDFDWSFGLGSDEDDVEQAAEDFSSGVRSRAESFGDTLFSEDVAGESLGEVALSEAGFEQRAEQYDRTVRNFGSSVVTGSASIVGSAPEVGLEAAETVGYTATNPREAASQAPGTAASAAVTTTEAAQQDPAGFAGELVGGAAFGAGINRARQGFQRSPGGSVDVDYEPRGFAGDDRGELTFGRRGSGSGDSDGSTELPDNIDEMLERMERGQRMRDAEARAEQRVLEEQLEAGRRQERGDEPRTVSDSGPGGDYVAEGREGRTVTRGPDTSRSGPTEAQQSFTSGLDTDLSPRESQLAAQTGRETPFIDLRGVDVTDVTTPSTDLRATGTSSASGGGGLATTSAAAVAADIDELVQQAQRQEVTAGDTTLSGNEDTTLGALQSAADDATSLMEEAQSESVSAGVSVSEDIETATDTATRVDPMPGTDTGEDTETGVSTDTDTGVATDTDTVVDQDSDTTAVRDTDTRPPVTDRPVTPGASDPDPTGGTPPSSPGGTMPPTRYPTPTPRRPRPRFPWLDREFEGDITVDDIDIGFDEERITREVPDPGSLGLDEDLDDSADTVSDDIDAIETISADDEYEVIDDDDEYDIVNEDVEMTDDIVNEDIEMIDDIDDSLDTSTDLNSELQRDIEDVQAIDEQIEESATQTGQLEETAPSTTQPGLETPVKVTPETPEAVEYGYGFGSSSTTPRHRQPPMTDLDGSLDELEKDLDRWGEERTLPDPGVGDFDDDLDEELEELDEELDVELGGLDDW